MMFYDSLLAILQLKDLVVELCEVEDWFHLGLHLDVPYPKLICCQRSSVQNAALGKTYVLRAWMDKVGSKASWADIVAALVKIRMRDLAQRLAEKYGVWYCIPLSLSLSTVLSCFSVSQEFQCHLKVYRLVKQNQYNKVRYTIGSVH